MRFVRYLNTCIISSSLPIFYKSHINSLHHTVIVIPALAITTFCKREITLNSVYCIGWVNVVLFNLVSTMLENLQNLIQYIMTAIQHVEPPLLFSISILERGFKIFIMVAKYWTPSPISRSHWAGGSKYATGIIF